MPRSKRQDLRILRNRCCEEHWQQEAGEESDAMHAWRLKIVVEDGRAISVVVE